MIKAITSDSDHPQIVEIYKGLRKMGYIIDIGSQRADMLEARQEMFGYVRHSRLTIAPEAATEKLRRKIGKNISDEDIYKSVEIAAHQGFRRLQLFFIIGFPGETREDVMAISRMVKRARAILDEKDSSRTIIEVTVNSHIKKPHTEYEKLEQQDINTYFRYISKLKRLLATTHDVIVTHMERDLLSLECVLVRGLSKEGELIRKICEKKDSAEIRETDLKKMLKKGYYKYYRKLKDCIWKDIDLNP